METKPVRINIHEHGYVELVDYLGSDKRICETARCSNQLEDETKSLKEDENLIDYLIRMKHTSPLEMVSFTFVVEMPIFVMRQWVRHRTAKLNEWSGRYTQLPNKMFLPEEFPMQSKSNKQGRSAEVSALSEQLLVDYEENMNQSYDLYERAVEAGVAKELARINLPLATYTKIYWTMDLHNLFHFLSLRMAPDAQKEIRAYAEAILDLIRPIVPLACKAFEKWILNGRLMASHEVEIFKALLIKDRSKEDVEILLTNLGMTDKRDIRILLDKLM